MILRAFGTAAAIAALSLAGLAGIGLAGLQIHEAAGAQASPPITYVAGSTQKLCQLTGETDWETRRPTSSRTVSRFGLTAADHGYSFPYQGKLWFLFGDAIPTTTFRGEPNENRWSHDRKSLVNDAIAYATKRGPDGCPVLNFVRQTMPAIGAYADPVVTYHGTTLSLRTNESPNSGISVGGKLYVLFVTDNPRSTCTVKTCGAANLGYPDSSVIGVFDPQPKRPLHFKGLYTFSGPLPGPPPYASSPGRFVNVAIEPSGGWLYFWGTSGGSQQKVSMGVTSCSAGLSECYRHSPVYLARMLASKLGQQPAGGRPTGIEYLHGFSPDGNPDFITGSESDATPLFNDSPPCAGELGVEYDHYVGAWVMLYNCLDDSTSNPRGIWMRTAPNPWGPWSAPQTIFNPVSDHGYCYFIHSTGKCPAGARNPPSSTAGEGGEYGPYFIAGWTTGTPVEALARATSTIYYTVDTFVPYGQVILRSTIDGPPPTGIKPPGCTGSQCR